MVSIRKVTLALLLAAAIAALVMAVLLLWNYRLWQQTATEAVRTITPDERLRLLESHVELLSKRAGDIELLVLVLLGTSGLYSIVFVASSYLSSVSFARQADRSIADIKDQVGMAMGDLRELKEDVQRVVREAEPKVAPAAPPTKAGEESGEVALLHYELACAHAAARNFERAVRELARAFERQSRELDDLLACDIEDGGRLYELASTPPYDKAVNDVLLNVVL